MIRFITIVAVLFFSTSIRAQQGSIRGFVKGEKGEPLPSATVLLEGTKQNTLTNEKGEFQFQNIKAGGYKLWLR